MPENPSEEKDLLLEETEVFENFEIDESRRHSTSYGRRNQQVDINTIRLLMVAIYRKISWEACLRSLLQFLTPSFLQGPEARAKIRPAKLHPTAYLDGMRGTAAFCVFIFHSLYSPYNTDVAWGATGKYYDFWRLPIIRLPYSGSIGVAIFFVISGYALSYKPLRLLRAGKTLDGYYALSSTLFRRWARLFLPTAASTFIIFLLIRLGAYETLRPDLKNKTYWRHYIETHPARLTRFSKQFWHWARQLWWLSDVFSWADADGQYYDGHIWTIPVEFRNSLYLFLTILGTSRLRSRLRIGLVLLLLAYAWSFARWDFSLFLCGMLLAEWDHIRGAHVPFSALPTKESSPPKQRRAVTIVWIIVNIITLFLMSTPDNDCRKTPGYTTLCGMVPKYWGQRGRKDGRIRDHRYWQSIAAVLWVLSVSRLSLWKRYYESSIVQYLGKISYSIYLLHGMVLKVVGLPLELWIWRHVTGIEGYNRFLGWFLGWCVTAPVLIWASDIFWRMVDMPAVAFAKWVENKSIKED